MNFVTGGTGIVGSQLILDLLKQGEEVLALKRDSSNLNAIKQLFTWENQESLFSKIQWINGDIRDIGFLEDAFENVKRIFHCAAMVSFDPRDNKTMELINIGGTANVVNAAISKGVNELIYVSSTSAIGKQKKGIEIDENCNWDPGAGNSHYSFSKYFAELELWRGSEEGLNISIINPGIIIGPGEWGKSSTNVFNTMKNGLKFYSSGSNGFVDVRDVSKAMLLLSEQKLFNQRFLLISENLTFRSFFECIAKEFNMSPPPFKANRLMTSFAWRFLWLWSKITGKRPTITKHTARAAMDKQVYSNKKIRGILDFELIPVKEAVHRTAGLFLKSHH